MLGRRAFLKASAVLASGAAVAPLVRWVGSEAEADAIEAGRDPAWQVTSCRVRFGTPSSSPVRVCLADGDEDLVEAVLPPGTSSWSLEVPDLVWAGREGLRVDVYPESDPPRDMTMVLTAGEGRLAYSRAGSVAGAGRPLGPISPVTG